ncbi:aspartate aminotransferase family protein [Comamonas sp. JC664]|uniref:aminotransferase family protein n=1 Tax=Comamonas sp. JC664 TaxID=2801917 RepID=UPI00174C9C9C|nr:aspartate aminotransferase family protein [Comamonas sp. JC664]MBL0699229.1 aspartate aminotransferase family protein [Comamonas sp. JC664]GHH02136.1 aspartate aminotransferase family protein [Comamonas sp. KCTC 72670]
MRDEGRQAVRYPEGNVLLRNLARDFPVVTHGQGVHLFDASGKRYLDASAGALVASVGHGNREVVDRIHEQLLRVAYVNGTHFTTEVTEQLASRLCALAPPGLDRAAFLGSGSEAVEAAVKFVRQLWVERGQTQRTKVIARVPGYHGNTLYALSLSGRPHYKTFFGPMLAEVVTTPAPYPYRSGLEDYARDGAEHYVRRLEETLQREGPDTIAAFIAEPVIGSSAGASPPPPGYFERVSALCREYGILTIADEVMCGCGRTGRFFASERFDFTPDVLVLGKGISGGYAPLSALLVKQAHLEELRLGSGGFMHAQTYLQAPAMTAAGLAVLDYYERHGLVAHAARVGEHFQRRLREALSPLPHVGSVQGVGLMAGIEFVEDLPSRQPFPRARKVVEGLMAELFERGLVLWSNTGHADGTNGDLLMLGPPLVITEAEVDELVDTLAQGINHYFRREP